MSLWPLPLHAQLRPVSGSAGGGSGSQTVVESAATRPTHNVYWDEFSRSATLVTNLGTTPSGHFWHQVSSDAASQITLSNGFLIPHGLNNSQFPYYNAISNGGVNLEFSRIGGKVLPITNPGGFDLQGVTAIILSDVWPTFVADPTGVHIAIYEHLLHIDKWNGAIVHSTNFPAVLPKGVIYPVEFQWYSNQVWWTVGPHSGTFTHPDWHIIGKKDFIIYRQDSTTTNDIVNMWDSVWGGYVDPALLTPQATTDFTQYTNHSSAITFTNLGTVTIRSNTLASIGDSRSFTWTGALRNAAESTNQFQLGYGSQTNILDTGLQTASNTQYKATINITRISNTSQLVECEFTWGLVNSGVTGVPFQRTNATVLATQTNGVDTVVRLAHATRRPFAVTNLAILENRRAIVTP